MPAATLLVLQLSPLCLRCLSKRKLIPTPRRPVFVAHASACSQIIVTTSVRLRLLKQEENLEEVSMFTLLFFPTLASLEKNWLNIPTWLNGLLRASLWLLHPRSRSASWVKDKTELRFFSLLTGHFFQGTELCRLDHFRISDELLLLANK